jgi:hypothetical protein
MAQPRSDRLDHVLFWNQEELEHTRDAQLKEGVTHDQGWLRKIWQQLFAVEPTKEVAVATDDGDRMNNNEKTPLISLESWIWAHAIIRSRAVGLEAAPNNIMSLDYNNDAGDWGRSVDVSVQRRIASCD